LIASASAKKRAVSEGWSEMMDMTFHPFSRNAESILYTSIISQKLKDRGLWQQTFVSSWTSERSVTNNCFLETESESAEEEARQ
jgi:hypothetical protein